MQPSLGSDKHMVSHTGAAPPPVWTPKQAHLVSRQQAPAPPGFHSSKRHLLLLCCERKPKARKVNGSHKHPLPAVARGPTAPPLAQASDWYKDNGPLSPSSGPGKLGQRHQALSILTGTLRAHHCNQQGRSRTYKFLLLL